MAERAAGVNCFVGASGLRYDDRDRPTGEGNPMTLRAFAAILLLSGCFPVGLYYKQDADVARVQRDELACRVAAANQVPARMVTRMIPGGFLPPRRVCDAAGACHMIPGHRLPPDFVTEDLNDGLRREVMAQCMGDKGYDRIRLPQCPPELSAGVTQLSPRMPRLTESSCAVRLKGGGWQIVTPG